MRWGNCWFYALKMFFATYSEGGGLHVTKSRWSWVPHARYIAPGEADGAAISEFIPLRPRRDWFNRTFPFYSLWFRGRIRYGRIKGNLTEEDTDER